MDKDFGGYADLSGLWKFEGGEVIVSVLKIKFFLVHKLLVHKII